MMTRYLTQTRRFALAALAACAACTAATGQAQTVPPTTTLTILDAVTLPTPRREFRGVWIATVDNIDWPSRPGLTTDQQKVELLTLLDRAKALNLNAVVLQVRPAADALYVSAIEPWSPYLTGQMGVEPTPAYDPLAFAIAEAHKRGLELHAWFNPFRVRQDNSGAQGPPSANHVSQTHPEWVRAYGTKLWLDPGVAAARDYSLSVIDDVVRRYDVDGVHVDDYFYPYLIKDASKKIVAFPDDATFAAYQAGGGTLARSDWRRSNIDDFVHRMYASVKAIKPWVKVGISPFGIWRPGNPPQIAGMDSYEEIDADSRRWLNEGWVDYLSPQLYWSIDRTTQSFPVLLSWWAGENKQGRHLWPGLSTSGVSSAPDAKWPPDEVEFQIKTARGISGADAGTVLFSAQFMLKQDQTMPGTLPQVLIATVYAEPALIPASPWLTTYAGPASLVGSQMGTTLTVQPTAATAVAGQKGWTVNWTAAQGVPSLAQWLVQWRVGGAWHTTVLGGDARSFFVPQTAVKPAPPTVLGAPPVAVLVDLVAVTPIGHTGFAGTTVRGGLTAPIVATP